MALLISFAAGNYFGSISAVKAFVRQHNSPVTAPTGYQCWNKIDSSAPEGYQTVCGIVQPAG
jgi:hypothetical protein